MTARRILQWLLLIAGLTLLSVGAVLALYHWWASGMPFNPERSARLLRINLCISVVGLAATVVSCIQIFRRPSAKRNLG